MELAGRWVRVSTGAQDEQSQVPDIERYIGERGYGGGPTYTVHGKSAYHGGQDPAWRQVLADMRAGKIQVCVAWVADRVERRGIEALLGKQREAREAGGRLEFSNERHLNGAEDHAELMSALAGYAAQQESVRKAERIRIAVDAIRANGGVTGRAPYGYRITGDKYHKALSLHPAEARYLRAAADRYLAGDSLPKVCAWLDAEGQRSQQGGPFIPEVLSRLFRNPALMGRRMNDDRSRTTSRCEPILTREVFGRLQSELARRRKGAGARGLRENTALLTSIAACGKCGSPMYRVSGRYYRCHPPRGAASACGTMVKIPELDAWAQARLMAWAGGRRLTETVVTPGHDHQDAIDDLARDIRELDIDADDYDAALAALRAERRRLQDLPSVPATVREVPTLVTIREHWASLGTAGRRAYLLGRGVRVTVGGKDPATWRMTRSVPFTVPEKQGTGQAALRYGSRSSPGRPARHA